MPTLELGAFLGCQRGDHCELGHLSNEQSGRTEGREVMAWGLGTKWQGLAEHADLTRNFKDFNFYPASKEEPLNEECHVGFCFNKFTLPAVWILLGYCRNPGKGDGVWTREEVMTSGQVLDVFWK